MTFRSIYGHAWSENGWRMCDRNECVVALPGLGIPHTNTAPVRAGAAATVLNAWIVYYHRNIEPLVSPVWGWSATNQVATSNHLSGTAVDLNAPQYPWGYRTMPADRIAKVRAGLDLFEGTVYWGATWNRPDEMHYQLGYPEGDDRTAAFAARLNAGHLGIYAAAPQEDDTDMTPDQSRKLDEVHAALCTPRESLIDGAKRFDLATFVQLIDAATYRTEHLAAAAERRVTGDPQ